MTGRTWTPEDQLAMVEALSAMSGSRSAALFQSHGLGSAFNAPGRNSSKESRIVSALQAAEKRGDLDEILSALLEFLGRNGVTLHVSPPLEPADTSGTESMTSNRPPSQRVIFISHAYADRAVANVFWQALNFAGIDDELIFYSSARGTGIRSGEEVLTALRQALNDARSIIALVSPTYLERTFCVMEFGAAWATQKPLLPVVIPPLLRDDARSRLGNVQMQQVVNDADIADMLEDLHEKVSHAIGEDVSVRKWNKAAAHIRAELERAVETISTETATRSSAGSASTRNAKSPRTPTRGQATKAATPRTRVGVARADSSPSAPNSESALERATKELRQALSEVERHSRWVILHNVTWHEPYYSPADEDALDAQHAREVDLDEERGGWEPRSEHRKVRTAMTAAAAWRDLMNDPAESEAEEFEEAHDLDELDAMSHDVWRSLGLV